ncbi:MAG: tetratricopeptide repeat protein [Flavobacteriales bacterium]
MNRTPHLLVAVLLSLNLSAQTQQTVDATALYSQAVREMKAEDNVAAAHTFSELLAQRPEMGKAWYYRGLCRQANGDLVGAMHDLERSVALQPGDANAQLRLYDVYAAQGRSAEAIKGLNDLLMRFPQGPIAQHTMYSLGNAHVLQNDPASALAVYERLVKLAPDDAKAWFDRGVTKSHLEDLPGAIADMTKALELDPTLANAYAGRALALIHAERKAEACPDLMKANELGDTTVAELMAIYCD